MVNVIWTERSLTDLEDIGDYIAKDSIKYAKLTVQKLLLTSTLISTNPLQGRIVPESNNVSIREIIVGNYRVIYKIKDKKHAAILTVFHGARNLTAKDF